MPEARAGLGGCQLQGLHFVTILLLILSQDTCLEVYFFRDEENYPTVFLKIHVFPNRYFVKLP